MFMNCASVDVTGATPQEAFKAPRMFEANIYGAMCRTMEGEPVDFEQPELRNCAPELVSGVALCRPGGAGFDEAPHSSSRLIKQLHSVTPARSLAQRLQKVMDTAKCRRPQLSRHPPKRPLHQALPSPRPSLHPKLPPRHHPRPGQRIISTLAVSRSAKVVSVTRPNGGHRERSQEQRMYGLKVELAERPLVV